MVSVDPVLLSGGVARPEGVGFSEEEEGAFMEFERDRGCWRDLREFARERGCRLPAGDGGMRTLLDTGILA